MTTTAFCTVDRVTSAGRLMSEAASSCRVQDIPKSEVAGVFSVATRRNVKYEKSSAVLFHTCFRKQSAPDILVFAIFCLLPNDTQELGMRNYPYAWAPSESAMKGSKDQSFSVAGSAPSLTPSHVSISGPLTDVKSFRQLA